VTVETIKEIKTKRRREIMGVDSPKIRGFMAFLEMVCQEWYWLADQCKGPGAPIFRQFKARLILGQTVTVPVAVFSDLFKRQADRVTERLTGYLGKHNPKKNRR